jgi:hypothetical protein
MTVPYPVIFPSNKSMTDELSCSGDAQNSSLWQILPVGENFTLLSAPKTP